MPYPYGGKQRQVNVSLNTGLLQSKGLSPADIVTAIGNQNIILPAGTAKIGQFEYDVDLNSSPLTSRGAERSAHQALGQQHADLHARRRHGLATASRRRPTSSAWMASAAL